MDHTPVDTCNTIIIIIEVNRHCDVSTVRFGFVHFSPLILSANTEQHFNGLVSACLFCMLHSTLYYAVQWCTLYVYTYAYALYMLVNGKMDMYERNLWTFCRRQSFNLFT